MYIKNMIVNRYVPEPCHGLPCQEALGHLRCGLAACRFPAPAGGGPTVTSSPIPSLSQSRCNYGFPIMMDVYKADAFPRPSAHQRLAG